MSLVGVDQIGTAQRDHVRPAETRKRLAERTTREHVSVTERLERIDQHDIQVAVKAAVLETVVENHRLALQLFGSSSRSGNAVGILEVGNVRQALIEFERLVVSLSVGWPVAAADDRHTDLPPAQKSGEVLDHRSFSGTAERKIADTDYRNVGAMDYGATAVVATVADSHRERIGDLGQAQAASEHGSADASPAAANDLVKVVSAEHPDLIRFS